MSKLSELTAAPRSDILENYVLSPWTLAEFGEAEAEFERKHLERAALAASATGISAEVKDQMLALANDDVRASRLSYGSPGFDRKMNDFCNLPFILFLTLRAKHPAITLSESMKLVPINDILNFQRSVLEIHRYVFGQKKTTTAEVPPESQSTGSTSSPSSDATEKTTQVEPSADSTGQTSAS